MPVYMRLTCVRRVLRPPRLGALAQNILAFEHHYALAKRYVKEVGHHRTSVPIVDSFQCLTVEQDAGRNALLKALTLLKALPLIRGLAPIKCSAVIA